MAIKTLNEIGLYKELVSRQTSNAITYQGLLRPIEEDAAYLLEYIRTLFPSYPSHNIQHSYRILEYIFGMLSTETLSTITDTEIFCLIMAALFHDTGMTMYRLDDADNVRTFHPKISTEVLDKYFEEKMQLVRTRVRLKVAISFACEAHGMEIEDLYS
jgi:HD superfamily phosphodiesterase